MTAQTDPTGNVYEQFVDSFRKTAEATLSAQKELYQQWQSNWPGMEQPQAPWLDQFRQFQQAWSKTVLDLVRTHRETLDQQYRSGIESLEQAFNASQSSNPEEFRKRAEELCRKNLDCLKEISEAHISEFQSATTKWVELFAQGASPATSDPGE